MNNRFLVRGKDYNTGEWLTGCYRNGYSSAGTADFIEVPPADPDSVSVTREVISATLGQCTGLKDRLSERPGLAVKGICGFSEISKFIYPRFRQND